jgi:hypothetical protein
MDKNIFNRVYAKFEKKDYFGNKEYIRLRLKENPGYIVKPGEIKAYLKNQKNKSYTSTIERLSEYKAGKVYPQREKFTWAIIKEVIKKGL